MTKADEERLGRIAPALEVLDPNSGMDPQLNFDPNQKHARPENDDRIDPNLGLKPLPVGGGTPGSWNKITKETKE